MIASGGVGTLDHLVEGIVEGHADAVLAASIFHYGGTRSPRPKRCSPTPASPCVQSPTTPLRRADWSQGDHFCIKGAMTEKTNMEYRRLGPYRDQGVGAVVRLVGDVRQPDRRRRRRRVHAGGPDAGCNFFDNAEAYAGGRSEEIMGEALRQLGWPRWSYVMTTKLFWGSTTHVNMKNTLNRKYLMQAIDGSLERFGLDFVDVLYCHRADPDTPIEETVWAMSDIVSSGKALYWGTREWSADEIRDAMEIAERHHLHKPVTEQPQYNLLATRAGRGRVRRLYEDFGYGTDDLEPAGIGVLTGKYLDGIPEDSRGACRLRVAGQGVTDPAAEAKVQQLRPIADELGCTLAQLALAWCTKNPNVSTVITGASRVDRSSRTSPPST